MSSQLRCAIALLFGLSLFSAACGNGRPKAKPLARAGAHGHAVHLVDCEGDDPDLDSDPANCGACGNACDEGQQCSQGACVDACEGDEVACNGTCVDDDSMQDDWDNCGACGHSCQENETCVQGACQCDEGSVCLTEFSGVQQNVPVATLQGWTQCYLDTYADSTGKLSDILAKCSGSKLLLACRVKGSPILQLAAQGNRADVLFDEGHSRTASHNANGVEWYFSDDWSWGFAPGGDAVDRNECDIIRTTDSQKRMCWHTVPFVNLQNGFLQPGYRCGDNSFNGDPGYERLIFTAQ